MPITILPNDHPLYAVQNKLLEDIEQLKNDLNPTANQIELSFAEYFDLYNINDQEDVARKKWSKVKEGLNLLDGYPLIKEIILNQLNQFQPKHVAYYIAKRELENTIDNVSYDKELKEKGKDVLKVVVNCRQHYLKSENDEKTLTALLSSIDQSIKKPDDVNNFNQLTSVLLDLPKQKIYAMPILNALMGSLMIFIGTLGIVTSIASMILTGGASAPVTVPLAALSIGLIALGSAWIRHRNSLYQDPFVTWFRKDEGENISKLHTTCRLFKAKQSEHIKCPEPQHPLARFLHFVR